jgi:hypothetical protein
MMPRVKKVPYDGGPDETSRAGNEYAHGAFLPEQSVVSGR